MNTFSLLTAIVVVAICFFFGTGAYLYAQNPRIPEATSEAFEKLEFKSESDYVLKARLMQPHTIEEGKKYPLVLFLHGVGERGDNNQAQVVHGMTDFASDENRTKYPAFVLAPQCPKKKLWVDVDWGSKSHSLSDEPTDSMSATMELVKDLIENHPIDEDRIYVTGLSMGGYGTWDVIARNPKFFAAAAPICGGGDDSAAVAATLKDLPIFVVHGDKDRAMPVERSRKMVKALEAAGGSPIYRELEGVGHNSWSETYSDPEFFKWLFDQKR